MFSELPIALTKKLSSDYDLPRNHAVKGGEFTPWSRQKRWLLDLPMREMLNRGEPIALNISNTKKDPRIFDHMMSFACVDIDNKAPKDATPEMAALSSRRAAEAALMISEEFDKIGITYGKYHLIAFTGSKGWRPWMFFDKPLPDKTVFNMLTSVIRRCGYVFKAKSKFTENTLLMPIPNDLISYTAPSDMGKLREIIAPRIKDLTGIELGPLTATTSEKFRYITDGVHRMRIEESTDGKTVTYTLHDAWSPATEVDTLIESNQGMVVKMLFSQHQRRPGRFEIPVDRADILTFDTSKDATEAQWKRGQEIYMGIQKCPSELVTKIAPYEEPYEYKLVQKAKSTIIYDPVKCHHRVPIMMEMVMSAPCLKHCYEKAISDKGIYWERVNLVVAFVTAGFGDDEICDFFKYMINDDEDNANTGYLEGQVKHWRDKPQSCNCHVFAKGRTLCCPAPCGRMNPADPAMPVKLDIPAVTTVPMSTAMDSALTQATDTLFLATTRSGKTTEIVRAADRTRRKIAIVMPHNAIAEKTIQAAIEIVNNYHGSLKSFLMADTRRSCLALAEKIECHEKSHEDSAFWKLPRMVKPNCKKCDYYKENRYYGTPENPIVPNVLYGIADTEKKMCGYLTGIKNVGNWDLVSLSDKKFSAILEQIHDRMKSPMHALIQGVDTTVFDEASAQIETPHSTIQVRCEDKDGNMISIVEQIMIEIRVIFHHQLSDEEFHMVESKRINSLHVYARNSKRKIAKMGEEITSTVVVFQRSKKNVMTFTRNISPDEMERLEKTMIQTQALAEKYAESENEAPVALLEVLGIMHEPRWVLVNIPTKGIDENISINIPSKIGAYPDAMKKLKSNFIFLDATPSIVPLDKIFQRKFSIVNFGAPRDTMLRHVIISDNQTIRAIDILENRGGAADRLRNHLGWMEVAYGADGFAVLVPSKEMFRVASEMTKAHVMWHRGSEVVGVECKWRVGISVCPPLTPTNANIQLKEDYPEALKNRTNSEIHRLEINRQILQAEGRFKDPGNKVDSAVFAFGQPYMICKGNYINSPAPQEVFRSNQLWKSLEKEQPKQVPIGLMQMALWISNHIAYDSPGELKDLECLISGQPVRDTLGLRQIAEILKRVFKV